MKLFSYCSGHTVDLDFLQSVRVACTVTLKVVLATVLFATDIRGMFHL